MNPSISFRTGLLTVATLATIAMTGSACESTAPACSPTEGCTQASAELGVTSATITTSASDDDGLGVVQPGAIDVHFTVQNSGDVASEKKPLQIKVGHMPEVLVTLPAMPAHSEYTSTVHVAAPAAGFLVDTDTMSALVTIVGLDEVPDNDARVTPAFHLALPALRIVPVVDSASLRTDAALPARISIENVSHYATLGPAVTSWCIYDLGGRCAQGFSPTSFGAITLPAIAPMQSVMLEHAVTVPDNAAHHNAIDALSLGSCLTRGTQFSPGDISSSSCATVRDVEVKPDIEACSPVNLIEDQPVAGVPSCREPCDIVAFRANIDAGHTYRLELASGEEDQTLRWRTRYRESPVNVSTTTGFQPTVSGTYYLMTAPKFCQDEPTHAVVLRDISPNLSHRGASHEHPY